MSSKYLGLQFDIHGGGMDLKFPHHECEIAQSVGANGVEPVRYWLHANMLTINGTKMSKSLGNSILPQELFAGTHSLLTQAYSPMTLRFAMLQTHYRSTMDISNDALKAAQKGYKRVMNGLRIIRQLVYVENSQNVIDTKQIEEIRRLIDEMYEGMNDDFNTAVALAALLNLLKKINSIHNGVFPIYTLDRDTFDLLKKSYITFVEDIFGLKEEDETSLQQVMKVFLEIYKEAKHNKNFEQVDKLRTHFKSLGVVVKDMKDKIDWSYEE
jgi:cysteinyl-tRNA synthetase